MDVCRTMIKKIQKDRNKRKYVKLLRKLHYGENFTQGSQTSQVILFKNNWM